MDMSAFDVWAGIAVVVAVRVFNIEPRLLGALTGVLVTLPGPMGGRRCCGADMTGTFSCEEQQCDR